MWHRDGRSIISVLLLYCAICCIEFLPRYKNKHQEHRRAYKNYPFIFAEPLHYIRRCIYVDDYTGQQKNIFFCHKNY